MANTYINLNIHTVFSTRNRVKALDQRFREDLWHYMGGIAKENKIVALAIGGMEDHVHLLISIPATISVSKAVMIIKTGSSRWIHDNISNKQDFAWQRGYAAFSVSLGKLDYTIQYINKQESHHRKISFQEEYIKFLKESGIEYDERYVWG